MSRIGMQPIPLPEGVTVKISSQDVTVQGPKGKLQRSVHQRVTPQLQGQVLSVHVSSSADGALHGLTRSLLNNMVIGVSAGFSKALQLVGVGYRAQVKGQNLHMNLGFSHEVVYALPQGIQCNVEKNTLLTVSGIDKELVGQVAADIRGFRKPEPYHGKGVRYLDETIRIKAGKSAKK